MPGKLPLVAFPEGLCLSARLSRCLALALGHNTGSEMPILVSSEWNVYHGHYKTESTPQGRLVPKTPVEFADSCFSPLIICQVHELDFFSLPKQSFTGAQQVSPAPETAVHAPETGHTPRPCSVRCPLGSWPYFPPELIETCRRLAGGLCLEKQEAFEA